ncbi:MAG: alanine--tRNA ligase [Candidatus Omnitrophica bacterium]|nr:alanine--tRNA ligase [Candidatus Omnitrophota bacterium]
MKSSEIRKRFLEFFREKGHTVVESDLLVPEKDPTLLFTGAGMNQFKQEFLGRGITFTRAVSAQKCLRTGDLENVGKTPRHHTFFEMLGNFSFGDYFKKDAISWAWEFMTREMRLPVEKLWVSVYADDDVSYSLWRDEIKVASAKIVKLGVKDNFWPADAIELGPNGPCGPCSEIFYDWGKEVGCGRKTCSPACECGRFVEIWNLVFTEFERKSDGSLCPLPNKNIDTGMGLERMASVMQGVKTNFETDLFVPLTNAINDEFKKDGVDLPETSDLNLIADHVRAAVFAIADGVSPSNEKRGYVVRKLIRRAYLRGSGKGPFLYKVAAKAASLMEDVYPVLHQKKEHISAIILEEEKRFADTLRGALPILESMISAGLGKLTGEQIFNLVDTYGLPLDVILEETEEKKIELDLCAFRQLMLERKEKSRKGSGMGAECIFKPDQFLKAPNPEFSEVLPLEAKIVFILKNEAVSTDICEGECAEIIVDPQSVHFYAEAGGQVGDTGSISKPGALMNIVNTFSAGGRKIFASVATCGTFKKGDKVVIELGEDKKKATAKNHTATHLLQSALRFVLGRHVKQSGSFVDSERFRFDFSHMKKLSPSELLKVEDLVNGWVEEAILLKKETKSINEAKKEGALSFFGEKYAEEVRVVSIGEVSKEFCGGTHVDNTGDIGVIKIVSESSVAGGIRRIEALTGSRAKEWMKKTLVEYTEKDGFKDICNDDSSKKEIYEYALNIIDESLEINKNVVRDFREKILPAFRSVQESAAKNKKKIQKEKAVNSLNNAIEEADKVAGEFIEIAGTKIVSGEFKDLDKTLLRKVTAYLEKKADIVVLGSSVERNAYLTTASSHAVVDAGKIIKAAAKDIDGAGGGRAAFAQAGGKNPSGIGKALEHARKMIKKLLKEAEGKG